VIGRGAGKCDLLDVSLTRWYFCSSVSLAASWAGCSFSAERYALLRALKFCEEWGMERHWKEGKSRMQVVGSWVCEVLGSEFNDDMLVKILMNGYTYWLVSLLVGVGKMK
jgi:hypothetical protein